MFMQNNTRRSCKKSAYEYEPNTKVETRLRDLFHLLNYKDYFTLNIVRVKRQCRRFCFKSTLQPQKISAKKFRIKEKYNTK